MPHPLPTFKYHPDPLATGSIIPSPATCICCNQPRGYIYTAPVYAIEDYDDCICPWCIADGSAHQKLDASFHDEEGIGGSAHDWVEVSEDIIEEVAHRTPGYNAWQQAQWWTHCHDAAQFLGRAGHAELIATGPAALTAIRQNTGLPEGPQWTEFLSALDKDNPPTAYLFRCRHCGKLGGYQDTD